MSAKPISLDRIISGIADYDKESVVPDGVAWLRSVDYRTDPRRISLLPKTAKESGTVYQDLPKWFTPRSTTGYTYDASGNLYQRTSAGVHSLIRSVGQSHGNGLAYYGEDDFVYYTTDISIGRYGQFSVGSPSFSDDFLAAQGGVPTNTYSLDLESGSSQYGSKTDTASLSITSDITMEIYYKPESLPTVGNSMTLISKWNENSNHRSYRFDIYAISGYFGDGSDSSLTISSDTTEAPVDSSCTGTLATNSLSATNASFAAGQVILIHQTRGSGAGTWQRTKILSYTAGTITTEDDLNYSYVSGAQVRVMKQYTNVTINSAKTYTAKAWDGTVGGILAFLASGTVTVTGTITAAGKGFRGGTGVATGSGNVSSYNGEGTAAASFNTFNSAYLANGNGGGAAQKDSGSAAPRGAGGGGHAAAGTDGEYSGNSDRGRGGDAKGTADLTTMVFGGAGGGAFVKSSGSAGTGGAGGGIVFIAGVTLTISGAISVNGSTGGSSTTDDKVGGSGGGAGGSVLLKAQTATLGSSLITASAGSAGSMSGGGERISGGAGAVGRIHLDYYTSYTGTTSPTLDVLQDTNLVTTTTYQLRLSLSTDGTAVETLAKNATIAVDGWYHLAVTWDASDHLAEFFVNGSSIGDISGAVTSIYNSTAAYAVGTYFNSGGTATAFLDGKVDEPRLWNVTRTATQVFANKDVELVGNEAGLVAYHQLDNSASDSTTNANDLTLSGSPSYSTDVPFSAPTTRLDLDQEDTSTGSTTVTSASISEGASARQTFVPTKDPQKSIKIYLADAGDNCDWTITVHDALNREIATKTLTNAQVALGAVEFTFATPWTPILNASYHFHVTTSNTTGAPAVVSGSANNLETAQFASYYQFLVTDTAWHPLMHYSNMLAVGNGRYLGVWDASSYDPHRLKFPSGYRLRCLGQFNEYLAMGFMRGSTVTEQDQGLIALWDGTSDTYNLAISIPEGAINAILGSAGQLDFIAGSQLDLMRYLGGAEAAKIRRLPKITKDKTAEIYPGAMTMWQALERIGVAGDSDSSEVERGVYTYGSANIRYPESLSYDYPISTGSRLTTVDVGMVAVAGNKLLIGWRDGTAYGVDVVDPTGSPFSTGTIEYLIRDEGGVWKEKHLQTIRADYEPLNSGESVAIKHRMNRADSWVSDATGTSSSDDTDKVRANISGDSTNRSRHNEYQVAVDLSTSVSTSPYLLSMSVKEDVLEEEDFI